MHPLINPYNSSSPCSVQEAHFSRLVFPTVHSHVQNPHSFALNIRLSVSSVKTDSTHAMEGWLLPAFDEGGRIRTLELQPKIVEENYGI